MTVKAEARTIVQWLQMVVDAQQAPLVINHLYLHAFNKMEKLEKFVSKLTQMSPENISHQADVIKNEAKAVLNEARKAQAQVNGEGGVMDKATEGKMAVNGSRVESDKDHGVVNDGWIICDCEGPDKEANAKHIVKAWNGLNEIAEYIHYPAHWDVSAYPTLFSAIQEIIRPDGCSVCREPEAYGELLEDSHRDKE